MVGKPGIMRRGRAPLRYQLDIIPKRADDLPEDMEHVSLVWERGGKISYTDAEPVDGRTHSAEFKQIMRQSATLYRQDNAFLPKEYIFKVQEVRNKVWGSEKRKTAAKGRLDMSQYCSYSPHPETQEVVVQLAPKGRVTLSITTTWLQHATGDETNRGSADSAAGDELSTGLASQGASSSDGELGVSAFGSHVTYPFLVTPGGAVGSSPIKAGSAAATAAGGAAAGGAAVGGAVDGINSSGLSPGNPFAAAAGVGSSPVRGGVGASSSGVGYGSGEGGGVPAAFAARHRRISSSPALPDVMEGEREGLAGADSSNMDRPARTGSLASMSQSANGSQRAAVAGAVAAAGTAGAAAPGSGLKRSPLRDGSAAAGSAASSSGAALREQVPGALIYGRAAASANGAGAAEDNVAALVQESMRVLDSDASDDGGDDREAARQPPGILGGWLGGWGFGAQGSGRGASSEELLRQIGSTSDVARLQAIARGLLAERNDWRLKATEAEHEAEAARHATEVALRQKGSLAERLGVVEAQLLQTRESVLLEQLVETKMALAQADFACTSLRGQLNQERSRARELAARLTALQSEHDRLMHVHTQETAAVVVSASSGSAFGAAQQQQPEEEGSKRWSVFSAAQQQQEERTSKSGSMTGASVTSEGRTSSGRLLGWGMGRLLGLPQSRLVGAVQ